MTIRRFTASFFLAAFFMGATSISAVAQPKPGHLDEVLREMDGASAKFKSAEADFQWDLFERVVNQTTSQKGTIYFVKDGMKTQMGAKIISPATKFLDYKDGTLRVFDPGPDHLTTVLAKQNQAQTESFLTLGFGGSGKDLAKAWTIADLGTESMSDGAHQVETAKLDLVSKDPGVRNMCTHITIWIDTERGISLKQVFYMPSEDRRTAVYSNIRYNERMDQKTYEIKTDSKTTRDQH
jgi:outer membrane lipoprotein-sorting protein